MKRERRKKGIILTGAMLITALIPVVSQALPTNYYGKRISTGDAYYSFTYSNGYEQGSSVQNIVMAQMSGSASSRRTKAGVGSLSLNSGTSTGNALHGVGSGTTLQLTWTEN